jgi:hypothetical protein
MSEPDQKAGPEPDEDERPWEHPDAVRRDCEPHRATLLRALGVASAVFGVLSGCLFSASLISVPLGLTAWSLAERDLAKMRNGMMDPEGSKETNRARSAAVFGVGVSIGALLFWGLVFVLALRR